MDLKRDEIKKTLIKKYKNKLRKEVLEKNIEGLIDDYIEKAELYENQDKELPTKNEIKKWFFEQAPCLTFKYDDNSNEEEVFFIDYDKIYLKDKKMARLIYKKYYNYVYIVDDPVPNIIKILIKEMKILENSENKKIIDVLAQRLNNIALLGAIRYYHLEKTPYLCQSQMNTIIIHFRNVLNIIDRILNGKYKNEPLTGEVSLFGAFDKPDEQLFRMFKQ